MPSYHKNPTSKRQAAVLRPYASYLRSHSCGPRKFFRGSRPLARLAAMS